MNVLVIDGQGGGLGRQLVAAISAACPEARLTAVGTNSLATSAMLKAGTVRAATGENAVVVNCRTADVIVGPIGIVIADALLGEITPAMAAAVCQSPARRVLVPINHCENIVVGVPDQPIGSWWRQQHKRSKNCAMVGFAEVIKKGDISGQRCAPFLCKGERYEGHRTGSEIVFCAFLYSAGF